MTKISPVAKYSVYDPNSNFFTSKDSQGNPIMDMSTAIARRDEIKKFHEVLLIRQNKTWQLYNRGISNRSK